MVIISISICRTQKRVKKLVLVLATLTLVSEAREAAVETAEIAETVRSKNDEGGKYAKTSLVQVLFIQYPIIFWKKSVLIVFDFGNKVNVIYPTFAKELGLLIRPIDIGA